MDRPTGARRTCVLVVGIDDYDYDKFDSLKNAVKDAKAVEEGLRQVGVKRIVSTADSRKCTYDRLIDTINEYLSKLRKGDVALVYIAAHGAIYRNQHVFLTTTSSPKNMADTCMQLERLITWLTACYVVACSHASLLPVLTSSPCFELHSIAQRSPRLTVLMYDSCRVLMDDEPSAEPRVNKPTLNVGYLKVDAQEVAIHHACQPGSEATDSG